MLPFLFCRERVIHSSMYVWLVTYIHYNMPTRHAHPKNSSRQSKCQPTRKKTQPHNNPTELLGTRFSAPQLLSHFRKLLPIARLGSWLAVSPKGFYLRAFTPLITLWYCIFQRLSHNHHLSHVVEDALNGGADRLSPRGKALSRRLCSEATTSFSDARQRLPLEIFHKTLRHTATQIGSTFKAQKPFGLNVALLDGSTFRLRPFGDIPQHFSAHRPGNCKKQPYWCVVRVVTMICLATGAVLDTAMASLKASEQALSAALLKRSWEKWLLVADRNFGVFSVACAVVAAHAHLLARLTQARAAKLARLAGVKLAPGLDVPLKWCPSNHDQLPEGLTATPIEGRLVVVRLERPGFRSVTLYLFTTLPANRRCTALALAKLYGQRWRIELCFRYIKAQMDLGFLECHSADMARKEWLAGLIAYNLIRWTMAAAAAVAKVPVHLLSFSRARELLLGWCLRGALRRPTIGCWKRLLERIAKAQLPKRRKRRQCEPRAVRLLENHFPRLNGSRATAREKLAKLYANS